MTEVIVQPTDREFQAAQALENALNDFCWNPKKFAKACTGFHRTLQQSLFRSIVEILKAYADENRSTDARNEASKEGSQKLLEVLNEIHAPFI
jgi:hypothetical protein